MTKLFILQGKGNTFFLSYLKTLSMHLEPVLKPAFYQLSLPTYYDYLIHMNPLSPNTI